MTNDDLVLRVSKDQALVLFEFLSRSDEANGFLFEDEAEQRVVWLLQAQLERQLSEPVPPQNPVDGAIVDVSVLGVNLAYPHASAVLRR